MEKCFTLATSVVLLSLPFFLLGGCKKAADDSAEKTPAAVSVVHPKAESIIEDILADATLSPVAQASLIPRISAPVRAFYVQRGSRVKAGQLVATLENNELEAAAIDNEGAYQAAQGAYTAATQAAMPEEQTKAQLDLQQAKATLDLNNSILASRQQLLAKGAIPGRDVDTARTTALQSTAAYDIAKQHYDTLLKSGAKAALETAQGQLTSAKGKYLGAQAMLGYTQIRTPISGVVTDRALFAGETPAAGAAVVTVMDTTAMIAKLHIAEELAQHLKIGSPATLTVPGIEDPVNARVSLISPALDPGSTTVEVWLRASNPDGKLKVGTPVHVKIKGQIVPNALTVPTEAVQRSPEGEGKIVMVAGPDGRAQRRTITIGIQTAESTQILSGLKLEDGVIIDGAIGLDDAAPIKIEAAKPKGTEDDDKKAGKE